MLLSIDPAMTKMIDMHGASALHMAARNGRALCVQTLLSIDPEMITMVDRNGTSAVHIAASKGHDAGLRTLLSYSAKWNAKPRSRGQSTVSLTQMLQFCLSLSALTIVLTVGIMCCVDFVRNIIVYLSFTPALHKPIQSPNVNPSIYERYGTLLLDTAFPVYIFHKCRIERLLIHVEE
eukprot:PhF_6_TR12561/c0_g1_i3/m.19686